MPCILSSFKCSYEEFVIEISKKSKSGGYNSVHFYVSPIKPWVTRSIILINVAHHGPWSLENVTKGQLQH